MPGGRPTSYLTTGPGAITPVSSLDLNRCKANLSNPRRDAEWRGTALPVNTTMQRKAALIYCYGAVNSFPCNRCMKGSGPFRQCVVAFDDNGNYIAHGVCANCYWLHRTDVCSSRHVLPCESLFRAGHTAGEFEIPCRVHCGGAHVLHENPLIAAVSPALYSSDLDGEFEYDDSFEATFMLDLKKAADKGQLTDYKLIPQTQIEKK